MAVDSLYNLWLAVNNAEGDASPQSDYDIRGAYDAGLNRAPGPEGHFPDTFKYPWHPTFSDQSQYYEPGMPALTYDEGQASPALWEGYAKQAQQYLDRPNYKGTPLTGDMITKAALDTYQKTGKKVPLELALAQGQFETQFGTDSSGRPGYKTNPWNVGEFDSGTRRTFKTTEEGTQAYFDLMANDYLRNKNLQALLDSEIRNYQGNKYATGKGYSKKVSDQIDYIRKFFKNN